MTDTKRFVPVVTLSKKDNVKLTKQLSDRLKQFIYWSKYQSNLLTEAADSNDPLRIKPGTSFKEFKDYLFLVLIILVMMLVKLKKITIESIFFEEYK